MKYLIALSILLSAQCNSLELHTGFFTKHVFSSTYYDKSASNFHSRRNIAYNENNNLILAFNSDGFGVGTMINSYNNRSYLVQKKYTINKHNYGITHSYSASIGLASGYFKNNSTGIAGTFSTTLGISKGGFGVNASIFNFAAIIGTLSYAL